MLDTLEALFTDQIKDLYSAENQLVKTLPKIAKAVESAELKSAITAHLEQTRGHVERLETIAEGLGFKPSGKKCKAMEGLLAEGAEALEAKGEAPVIDAAIIAAAQRVEHYEISAYGTARAIAQRLGRKDFVKLLQATLDEEAAADKTLTKISEGEVLAAAQSCGCSEEANS